MAMTNAMIIQKAKQELFDAGILSGTGRMLAVTDADGNTMLVPEIEDIHTFAGWKSLGYKVKKGQHAIARFTIWKYASKHVELETESGTTEHDIGRCFPKEACWFSRAQVEEMEG